MQEFREIITRRDHAEARELLRAAGLDAPEGAAFGLGCYEDGFLGGVGFLAGNILCGICIHPSRRGAGLAAGIVSRLIQHAAAQGRHKLLLFTSAAEMPKFQEIGLKLVAQSPHAALLEFGQPDCAAWLEDMRGVLQEQRQAMPTAAYGQTGAIVMNANPFTLGHLHLVRAALQRCVYLCVFVVEEDASVFPFDVRLALVRQGLGQEPRAIVLPAGPYMVSRASFPSYFTGKTAHSRIHAELDSTIFAVRIAKVLDIGVRFVGQEPSCEVTARYNAALKEILPQHGVVCVEIERLSSDTHAISASRVRELLAGPDADLARDDLRKLVPETTLGFVQSDAMLGIRNALRKHQNIY
ncbi:MAG: [citrate (pro-3S)-lyase] ligase [Deltaproteobacteria bacterium]|jgi:[citrate (pro-3S)-lyase] ligase|nr:[citrate (pro-3S)-lyase] ligase [Deltaproteobacteria bacterium]